MSILDKYKGCLLGLAIGDSLGTTLEFSMPGTFLPINDMIGGGVFGLRPGEWTDDTSMALCLADSLLSCQGFDPVDQLKRYSRWMNEGYLSSTGICFDIGNATRSAIEKFGRTGESFCGSIHSNTAGNGSIMRLAPIPMYYLSNSQAVVHYAAESSKTTHAAEETVSACKLLAAYTLTALQGGTKQQIIDCVDFDYWNGPDNGSLATSIEDIRMKSFLYKEPPVIKGSGYVVESLEAALWAFAKSNSFEEGALLAVNLGDDSDTTGAVYGQIAGAYYGYSSLPAHWIAKIAKLQMIEGFAISLFKSKV
ncbi:ADP-ribosylglycohydrolase family protein [Paenibacillus anaericanus]|uniref:ADP-ribosylglycohydrolase family protein n=1 Tax=Paenibacillus anaericanus TaxID=170367 RepID=A0A433XVS4_9BACL|nr:ADP-ribosylglycohydrolase family protein [Paenibacillus anaericanus]RUT38703.1 ADP-ribosylglycohydrolase family protein [Paenibacillus anaericanus]